MSDIKPAEKRIRGAQTRALSLVIANAAEVERPSAPSSFLLAIRNQWDEFWASPHASLVSQAHRPALLRLFELRDERERTMRAVRRVGRMVAGSQGQWVVNPLLKIVMTLDIEIRNLEDRFGLSPLSGLRMGAVFTETQRSLADLNRAAEEDGIEVDADRFMGIVDVGSGDL